MRLRGDPLRIERCPERVVPVLVEVQRKVCDLEQMFFEEPRVWSGQPRHEGVSGQSSGKLSLANPEVHAFAGTVTSQFQIQAF